MDDGEQMLWFQDDIKKVNRTATPWLIVAGPHSLSLCLSLYDIFLF